MKGRNNFGLKLKNIRKTMSKETHPTWCDSTANPMMGGKHSELFAPADTILDSIDKVVHAQCGDWTEGQARELYAELINEAYDAIEAPSEHHSKALTTTNLYHLRKKFIAKVKADYGKHSSAAAHRAIEERITSHAAMQHFKKGYSLVNPERKPKKGYAPTFESVTKFNGRGRKAAALSDLLGCRSANEAWKVPLARIICIGDLGDAFSDEANFEFLEAEMKQAIRSEAGQKHLWVWSTMCPDVMGKFAERIGGFFTNVCVMTTLTRVDEVNLKRLDDLKAVNAAMRALCLMPAAEIEMDKLNLDSIDWVILEGESKHGKYPRALTVEWVEKLRAHCQEQGVAFYLQQLGGNPSQNGMTLGLKDGDGADWDEWSSTLRVREFPQAFHEFRKEELDSPGTEYPDRSKGRPNTSTLPALPMDKLNEAEREELEQCEECIQRGKHVFEKVGYALLKIKNDRLYREKYKSFQEYCELKHGFSRQYGYLVANAVAAKEIISPKLAARGLPLIETERGLRLFGGLKGSAYDEVIDIVAEEIGEEKASIPYPIIEKAVKTIKQKSKKPKGPELDDSMEDKAPVNDAVMLGTDLMIDEDDTPPIRLSKPIFRGFLPQSTSDKCTSSGEGLAAKLRRAVSMAEKGDLTQVYEVLEAILKEKEVRS
ncbi:DUF5131 family protein [Ruficoccus sp. ZRK36]|uniref:DUF5131 family protein n=1 Tax=Ruficoccus sp. ZRK36 TaxID=2866311 RepID=UPI001C72FA42|nr:DUF5131 family protein [Ruficoccus sp. ZRK36]QYY36707.1 DUF5131 family protein [Ruficoccus sp. ZRK36]QYY37416.1 DUF5131 family protein [Ruficoccus sp. ZRK36]